MPLADGGMIPFRRMTDPLQIPVGPVASQYTIPQGFIPNGANAFWIVNPNNFWVRFKGSYIVTGYAPVVGDDGAGTGWLFKPGYSDVFTTQFPDFVSSISVAKQGITPGSGFIEMAYGMGA